MSLGPGLLLAILRALGRRRDRRAGRWPRSATSSSPTGSGSRPGPPPGWPSPPAPPGPILGGAAASVAGRRIAFYELVAATLLLLALALGPLVFVLPALRGLPLVLHTWQYQGRVVLTAGLLLVCLSTGALAFLGSTLAFLLTGSGRLDPSIGWELFVARSHLRLHARTLGALFLIVVTGVVPGLLAGIAWSAWQDRKARLAALSGEPHERPRLPATMLMTLISIGGVATGVWALTVVLSVMSGFEQDLKSKILGAHAHGVVLKYGQNDFTDWRGTQERVLSVPGVAASTPFLYAEVMLSAGQNLTGVDPEGGRHLHAGEGHRDPAQPGGGEARVAGPARGDPAGEAAPGAGRGAGGRRPAGRRRAAPAAAPARSCPGSCWAASWRAGCASGSGDVVNVVSPFGDIGPAGPAAQEPPLPRGRPPLQRLLRVRRQVRLPPARRGAALLRHRRLGDRARAQGERRERGPPGDAQGAGRPGGLPLPHQGLGGDEPQPLLGAA